MKNNWMDELVEFYDFVWREGLQAHNSCVNKELIEDFAKGGNKFEEMKALIVKKFPTKEAALKAFKKS